MRAVGSINFALKDDALFLQSLIPPCYQGQKTRIHKKLVTIKLTCCAFFSSLPAALASIRAMVNFRIWLNYSINTDSPKSVNGPLGCEWSSWDSIVDANCGLGKKY
jgi:hypothetical protein